ncbi:type II toxin-antitoxin system RelE/ParE family toxin [Methyloversatilis universalis]|uniref:type II toxin-antitoxin system RelE/ParE family toxin n=1 Tax=Methyloversatilis universalis TaxID=378211 RepID=UPI0003801542|nr:type II toxin-antitoxin system RelE/ParE family toxin [Methyloversatilis universalis]
MALTVRISARAATEIRRAAAWWQENRSAASSAVAADFSAAIALLVEQPGIGARHEGSRVPDVRRLYLGRLGYFIYYRADGTCLDVLAFWHGRRESPPRL